MTLLPSFWSMLTTFLGFMSLLFVEAAPLRELGISGALGTVIAFSLAYFIYPFFLHMEDLRITKGLPRVAKEVKDFAFYERLEVWLVVILLAVTAGAAFGLPKLIADPSLFSYFKQGDEIRNGMEYIDQSGGSVPLKAVIRDQDSSPLDTREKHRRLRALHQSLEEDPAVGKIISIAVMLDEARRRPMAGFLGTRGLLKAINMPAFITEDRKKALFLFRMNEADRTSPRLEVVDRLSAIIKKHNFVPELMGGIYLLQGKLEQLVVSSVAFGLTLILGTFIVMGLILSHSAQVMIALFVSLSIIAVCTLGAIGHLQFPLDIVSAPAVNVGIAMGIDAAIHMLVFVRRHAGEEKRAWDLWDRACARLWKPILCDMVVVSTGFGVFSLSNFPPTQRFGFAVVLGAVISVLVALFVLPCLASLRIRRKAA